MSETPRQIIARVHAERAVRWKELGSGDIADTIIAELDACGFVIVPREPTEAMVQVARKSAPYDRDVTETWPLMVDEALR